MSFRIKVLIALMSLALLGLVLIQFYWIDNAIVLKKEDFNQRVVLAMRNVVHSLEKEEMVENMRRHRLGRQLIHRQMMKRRHQMMRGRYNALPGQAGRTTKIERKLDGGRLRVTEQHSSDSTTHIITREFQSSDPRTSVRIDLDVITDQDIMSDSAVLSDQLNSKTAFIDEMIFNLMEVDHFRTIEERLNPAKLDSVVRSELKEVMINTDVEYGVFDFFGRLTPSMNEMDNDDGLRNSPYKARLFPNDIFGEPYFLSFHFPGQQGYLLKSMWVTLGISGIFLLLIVGAFGYTINVIQSQKQLSMIKNDFISNMTHELKTPISTISLACEALADEEVTQDAGRKNRFLQMISQENKRLAMLVENVLKSSLWDRRDFKLKLEELDVNELINEIAESSRISVEKNGGELILDLKARNFVIKADRVHLTNIMHNLVDNAIKYSQNSPRISLGTSDKNGEILIEVSDNGIGIPKDQQNKIFDKFYRIPTGNIHDVKGFGLGLNYVRNVVRNHGGEIHVKSGPGKGSTFYFNLPVNPKA